MPAQTRFVASPDVMMGRPVVRGRRITVEHILEELAAGPSVEVLLEQHPRLTREDGQAALAFAAESVRVERLSTIQRAS